MSTQETIKSAIIDSISAKTAILNDENLLNSVQQAAEIIINAYKQDKKVLFCGNGGSAADAQHLAAELSGRFYKNRPALYAEALHCNTSYLTAVANDYGYHNIYSRLVEAMGNEGDVLVGLSTSGKSSNVLMALSVAKANKMHTIAFTGEGGLAMKNLVDINISTPSSDTPRIQEVHMMLGHIICYLVEKELFP